MLYCGNISQYVIIKVGENMDRKYVIYRKKIKDIVAYYDGIFSDDDIDKMLMVLPTGRRPLELSEIHELKIGEFQAKDYDHSIYNMPWDEWIKSRGYCLAGGFSVNPKHIQ
jgi:hypothetical protein